MKGLRASHSWTRSVSTNWYVELNRLVSVILKQGHVLNVLWSESGFWKYKQDESVRWLIISFYDYRKSGNLHFRRFLSISPEQRGCQFGPISSQIFEEQVKNG